MEGRIGVYTPEEGLSPRSHEKIADEKLREVVEEYESLIPTITDWTTIGIKDRFQRNLGFSGNLDCRMFIDNLRRSQALHFPGEKIKGLNTYFFSPDTFLSFVSINDARLRLKGKKAKEKDRGKITLGEIVIEAKKNLGEDSLATNISYPKLLTLYKSSIINTRRQYDITKVPPMPRKPEPTTNNAATIGEKVTPDEKKEENRTTFPNNIPHFDSEELEILSNYTLEKLDRLLRGFPPESNPMSLDEFSYTRIPADACAFIAAEFCTVVASRRRDKIGKFNQDKHYEPTFTITFSEVRKLLYACRNLMEQSEGKIRNLLELLEEKKKESFIIMGENK